jgi:CHASE3 domain sensor protein
MSITRVTTLIRGILLTHRKNFKIALNLLIFATEINKTAKIMEKEKKQSLMQQMKQILRKMNDNDLKRVINEAKFQLVFGRDFMNKHYPL